jgi:hypothetical protein
VKQDKVKMIDVEEQLKQHIATRQQLEIAMIKIQGGIEVLEGMLNPKKDTSK